MKLLGIETSCDETAAAVVTSDKQVLSNIVRSQLDEHTPYGGVVPEIASRAHVSFIEPIIQQAMEAANTDFDALDGIAVTAGPGLIGGVIVGVMVAKGIAAATGKPLVGVNHLEGHALTARLTDDVPFPFLLLLVSGGHCQILAVEGVGKYTRLGGTLDDALGEAFDKTAKMLGLGYPGGPIVEKLARDGDDRRFNFPRSMIGRAGCDFSFSGLKSSIYRTIENEMKAAGALTEQDIRDVCASFQRTAGDILEDRIQNAIALFKAQFPQGNSLVIAGGVAANQYLNGRLNILAQTQGFRTIAPPLKLCTDNAAMIAWAGLERLQLGLMDTLDITPKARWSLEDIAHV